MRTSSAQTATTAGADVEAGGRGAESTFRLAWGMRPPNAIVTVVALYNQAQSLPLLEMYGKEPDVQNRRRGRLRLRGDAQADCAGGQIDTEPLITHTYPLSRIEEAYALFENRQDGVIKVAVEC